MPAGFRFDGELDIILPLRIDRGQPIPGFRLLGVARLKPGVTLAQANADVARILAIWFENSGAKTQRSERAGRRRCGRLNRTSSATSAGRSGC